MLAQTLREAIQHEDTHITDKGAVRPPKYDPLTHYLDVSRDDYYRNLIVLRHIIKMLCDGYMNSIEAKNIDLFMLTPSVSSPMGPGSDSEAIPIEFGGLASFLTDSSQFGFEPIVMNGIDKAYCYLPSLRGEKPDARHLNQFFHCEIEIRGTMDKMMKIAEDYIQYLCQGVSACPNLIQRMSTDPVKSAEMIAAVTRSNAPFQRITFDAACDLLTQNGYSEHITTTQHGRDINFKGELALMQILKTDRPIWMTHFDRDRVAFYQKPDPLDESKVLNADLLFPPLTTTSFGGEILGLGQRQDTAEEILESLKRQGLNAEPYEWYINLRKHNYHNASSGFGLGIERYISWVLGLDNIRDAILYPRLMGTLTTP